MTVMNKITAVLKLTRIEHSVMLVVAVIAAELLAKGLPTIPILILSLLTPIFVSMGAFAINDYFDVEVDRLNRRTDRPLVNGSLTWSDAAFIAAFSFVFGVFVSIFINTAAFIIALVFAALAFLYSYRLKEILLIGNIYVALSMVIPFIYGSYVVGSSLKTSIILISIMIFTTGLGREIQGAIRDYEGDVKARKLSSLPRIIGLNGAAVSALLLYLFAISISAYLFMAVAPFRMNLEYAAVVTVTDVLLLYIGLVYMLGKSKLYERMRTLSLIAMSMALISILIAPLAL